MSDNPKMSMRSSAGTSVIKAVVAAAAAVAVCFSVGTKTAENSGHER